MANLFNNSVNLTDLVETAYDRKVEWALRSMPQFRAIVDKRPEAQAMPGDVVVFTIQGDLAALATSALSETVDLDAVARPAPTRVSVTLAEYGNAEINTIRLEKLAFTNVSDEQSITIARNMADTMDRLVRNVLDLGTQTLYLKTGAITAADPTGTLDNAKAALFAVPPAKMRGDNIMPRMGEYYVAYVHPDVSYDLRLETGDTGWLKPHTDGTDTGPVYAGQIGSFVGNVFIETPRVDGPTSSRYTSYVVGRQAIAEAVAVEPHVVVGPVVDKLKRFYPLGWHALLGWNVFRNEAIWKVFCNSSISGIS